MNNFFMGFLGFFKRIFEKDLLIKIFSIVSAMLIWFTVSINEYPTITPIVKNVPITIDMVGTYAELNNFKVSSQSAVMADVYLVGDRGEIGDIKASELKIIASAENVATAMEYKIPLKVVCSTGRKFSVEKIATDSNEELEFVTVDFDEIVSKEIALKPFISNLNIASGYINDVDDVVVVPSSVKITGPKDILGGISDAYVSVDVPNELTETYEYSTEKIMLFRGDTKINYEESQITVDKESFTVNIPVFKKATLPLEVSITNAPKGFDRESFIEQLVFSTERLEIATTDENIGEITSLNIGNIDMRKVDIGSEFVFKTNEFLPDDFQNLSNIDEIKVTCPSENLGRIMILINGEDINIINAPAQFDFDIISSGFTQVFIGAIEDLQITQADVLAQIDLINYDLEEKDYKFPVTFSTPSFSKVWNISSDGNLSPKATVTVTLKELE